MSLIRSLDESTIDIPLEKKQAEEDANTHAEDLEAEECKEQNLNVVELEDPSGKSNIDENESAIDELPHELRGICLGYTYDSNETAYKYPRTTFFNKIQALNDYLLPFLQKAADHILWGRADEAVALVKEHPALLNEMIEAKDPLGRRVKGTLLQIAAAAGDVNIREYLHEDDRGIVEWLSAFMPLEEVKKQLAQQFRSGWEIENEKRIQRYLKPLEDFAEQLVKENIPEPEEWSIEALQAAQAKCRPYIEKLRAALKEALIPDQKEVVTSGYLFDTQILYRAAKLFEKYKVVDKLGDWFTLKSDIFWVNGFGSLQCDASARDAQVMRKGIGRVIDRGEVPERKLKDAGGSSDFFVPSSRLGLSFFFGYFEPAEGRRWGDADLWKTYVEQKTAALKTLSSAQTIEKVTGLVPTASR